MVRVFVFFALGIGFAQLQVDAAEVTPELVGSWKHAESGHKIAISEVLSFNSSVKTPAGYTQVWPNRLRWVSTSESSGYHSAKGYFSASHGNFPFQVSCRHQIHVRAYVDDQQRLIATFYTPQGIWAVYQPQGGVCNQQGWDVRQGTFERIEP